MSCQVLSSSCTAVFGSPCLLFVRFTSTFARDVTTEIYKTIVTYMT